MDKQKGNMIFRNSLSFLVNLHVIAFHVSNIYRKQIFLYG